MRRNRSVLSVELPETVSRSVRDEVEAIARSRVGVLVRGELVSFSCDRIAFDMLDPSSVLCDDDIKEMLEALIDGEFSSVRELSFVRSVFCPICPATHSHDETFVGHEPIDGHHGRAHRPCFENKQNSDAH